MASTTFTGPILTALGLRDGFVAVEGMTIADAGFGEVRNRRSELVRGLIVPGLLDMHTHLGDRGARGDLPSDLREAVHPGGIKDRYFSNSPPQEQVRSYRMAVEEISAGVSMVLDFRECGLEGIDLAKEALRTIDRPRVRVLGRINGNDIAGGIIRSCDGLGIPSLSSADHRHRELATEEGAIYSIHASELYREDVERVLDLDPDLVIHMVSGTPEDWDLLAKAGIPVCVCPRANAAFGLDLDLSGMVRAGLRIVLGTDNALAVKQDMWREMEAAWILLRKGGMSGTEASKLVYDMATGRTLDGTRIGSKLIDWTPWWLAGWPNVGDRACITVLSIPEGDEWRKAPIDHVVRFSGPEQVLF